MRRLPLMAAAVVLLLACEARTETEGAAARAWFDKGNAALAAGNLAEARELFAQAASIAPDWALAYLQWGITEQTLEPDSARAQSCLERAVRLAPDNARAQFHLGLSYEHEGRLPASAAAYRAALRLRSELGEARFQLAGVLRGMGDNAGAILEYETILASASDQTGALVALAELYEAASERDRAEAALRRIVTLHPTLPYHLYRLAQFYDRVGEPKKAKDAFARAESLDPRPQRKMRKLKTSRR